jgi:hypothetical protein
MLIAMCSRPLEIVYGQPPDRRVPEPQKDTHPGAASPAGDAYHGHPAQATADTGRPTLARR